MMAEPVPSFVGDGLVLTWIDTVCAKLPWEIEAHFFGPGLPPRRLELKQLGPFLLGEERSYEEKDRCWTVIAGLIQREDRCGQFWQLLAAYLTLAGLRGGYWRLAEYADYHERQDVQGDLLVGFYTRLPVINTDRQNIAGRLIGSATGSARQQYQQRHPKIPKLDEYVRWASFHDVEATVASKVPGPGETADSYQAALDDLAADFKAAEQPLDPIDLELIARTRLDDPRATMAQAATELGLDLQVAYKRRQNLEKRISEFYHYNAARRGSHHRNQNADRPTDS